MLGRLTAMGYNRTKGQNIMSTEANTNTVTALTKWDAESEKMVRDIINRGASVPKALVLASPKGFVAKCRAGRRAFVSQNSDRILGEFAQQGFKLRDVREKKVSERSGDESVSVTFVKRGDVGVDLKRIMSDRGMTVEQLRAAVNQVRA